nr:hypothetical protein BaRGS_013854 [Batillaria attramentaria]
MDNRQRRSCSQQTTTRQTKDSKEAAFLKRLQKIKPSKGISRQEQLHAYNSTHDEHPQRSDGIICGHRITNEQSSQQQADKCKEKRIRATSVE